MFGDMRDFAAQVALLGRKAVPVSLDELEAAVLHGHRLPERAVHVTFDDGFRNNLEAAEILGRHRVPWSLFAIVNAVVDGYRPWYLALADAIDATSNVMLPNGDIFEMSGRERKRAFARRAKASVMAATDQDAAVDGLLAWKGMSVPAEPGWPMLDVAELSELCRAGVAVGNHSATHRNLARCSDDELTTEVSVARHRLEEALGVPVRHFAYPDGRHDRRVVESVGVEHRLAFATWTLGRRDDRLTVRRYEPENCADLERILDNPEPWYGARWLRTNAPFRLRETTLRRSA
jgi:peptidoglycan/xylan/chitin deacetylase (PgdA/CDA1 family)